MICCAFISLIFAALLFPIRYFMGYFGFQKAHALEWQLNSNTSVKATAPAFSWKARGQSFQYALAGLSFVLRNEHNARIHLCAALVVMMIGVILRVTTPDWLVLISAIIFVGFAETINTAFEYLCDVVSPEKNTAVGKAKDIAAGAVLISAVGAAVIGVIVFAPYIFALISDQSPRIIMSYCRG